jgi:hypothetical protein
VSSEQLNYLANPTVYRDKKFIVGYYLGNGGGSATKLKWNGLKLETLEHIDIDVTWQNNNPVFKLVSTTTLLKRKLPNF